MNSIVAVSIIVLSLFFSDTVDVALTGSSAPTQNSFKTAEKSSFDLSTASYRDAAHHHRLINNTTINWFKKRKITKRHSSTLTQSKVITYRILSYSKKLSQDDVRSAMVKAFRKWAEVIPRVFRMQSSSQRPTINIRFVEGTHSCLLPFTGANALSLGHSFLQTLQFPAEIHFNDVKNWTTRFYPRSNKINLVTVSMHFIGQVLGLTPQSVVNGTVNVMSDMGSTGRLVPKELQEVDIKRIQKKYELCETTVDAVDIWPGTSAIYFFKGNNYWLFNFAKGRTEPNYPRNISSWRGVPADIDEMLLWGHNRMIYFFKGNRYCRYDSRACTFWFYISQGWPGVPDNIDAAFTDIYRKTYFFKGNLVYLFDNVADKVSIGYPKLISAVFPGLPDNLDSAFTWSNMNSYFFKGNLFYIWSMFSKRANGPFLIKSTWKNLCFV